MSKPIHFVCSRRCWIFSPQPVRCFSTLITRRPHLSTTATSPTHFDFSGNSSDTGRALVSALGSCASSNDVTCGQQIHRRVLKSGLDCNGFICNSVLNMYAKCCRLADAESVFHAHAKLDSASFNILVGGYVRSGRLGDALRFFDVILERRCVSIWGRLAELAELAAAELAAIHPFHEGCKVLLSNVYADAERWEDVAFVREEMRTRDVQRSPALSAVV